jgi:hypothetical protein
LARIHGQRGRIYVNITSGGTAEPIAFLNSWSLNFATDTVEVTSFEDTTKVYVAGKPDASGTFAGWYDSATAQTYTAATDGVARKFYLYPDHSSTSQYWFGTGIFDFNAKGGTGEAVSITGNFRAASSVAKVG